MADEPTDHEQRGRGTVRRRTALLVAAPALALVALVGVVAGLTAAPGRGAATARLVVADPSHDAAAPDGESTDGTGPDLWYGPTDDASGSSTDPVQAGATSGTADAGTTAGTTAGTSTTGTAGTGTTPGTTTSAPGTTSSTTSAPAPSTTATTTRPPTGTTTTPPTAPDDPRYKTCKAANAHGYGPYRRGVDPEYWWYPDPDGDGVACD